MTSKRRLRTPDSLEGWGEDETRRERGGKRENYSNLTACTPSIRYKKQNNGIQTHHKNTPRNYNNSKSKPSKKIPSKIEIQAKNSPNPPCRNGTPTSRQRQNRNNIKQKQRSTINRLCVIGKNRTQQYQTKTKINHKQIVRHWQKSHSTTRLLPPLIA